MLLPDDKLEGWLCIFTMQLNHDAPMCMPRAVRQQLVDRGWIRVTVDCTDEDNETWDAELLPAGDAIVDLNAPDWGIRTIPEVSTS